LYLRGDAALLAGRLARDPAEAQRPSLTGRPLTEEVAEVMTQRAPLYESVAHAILDAALAPEGLLRQAVTALGLG
ncbi:MAG TPA: shikimate kinase II, partial [Desulfovibrio sp.]|nr:shikimate kinase II [Desulfovibrio sp.]